MKGNPEVGTILQAVLAQHMTAKDFYRLHRHLFKSGGYSNLARKIQHRKDVHDAFTSAIMDRMLFLGFEPDAQHPSPDSRSDIKAFYSAALNIENTLAGQLQDGSETSDSDAVTQDLLVDDAGKVQKNIKWLEKHLRIIADVGLDNYLAEML